jgi:hypothetical protein
MKNEGHRHSKLKIEGKMTFWGKIYIDNEGKNVIGCIYLMKISISNP